MIQNYAMKCFLFVLLFWAMLFGCSHEKRLFQPIIEVQNGSFGANKEYAHFIEYNIALKDMKYSNDYAEIDFIVDTDFGSTRIQNLIDMSVGKTLVVTNDLDRDSTLDSIKASYQYIVTHFRYDDEPTLWLTMEEIIDKKRGNCKDLSLLLLSILLSMEVDAHAAISNSHMWVNVNMGGKWFIIELDQDTERNKIYAIDGFYDRPLYMIFKDYSSKRKINEEK